MEPSQRELAANLLGRVMALAGDENFQWFLDEVVTAPLRQADADAKAMHLTPEQRTAAACVWNALSPIAQFLKERERTYREALAQRE